LVGCATIFNHYFIDLWRDDVLCTMNRIIFVSLVCFFVPISLAAQGPLDGYMKGRGHFDLAPSFSIMRAKTFIGGASEVYNAAFSGEMLSVFAAYGITDRFDVVASVPYMFTDGQNGLQDGGFYAKYSMIEAKGSKIGRFRLIAGMGVSLPLSNYEPTAAGAIGQKATVVPARLIAQWETRWGPFINLTGGYNWRLDDYEETDIARIRQVRPGYNPAAPPNYATFLLKAGFPAAHYYLDAWVEHQRTADGAGSDYLPNVPDLPQAYGVSYWQIGGTAYYSEHGQRGVFISGANILSGRNVSRLWRLTAGVVFKFGPK
jgi:hypothetical protein